MKPFVYPATFTPDREDGGYIVTFPDIPEAITQGADLSDALHQASDCLEEAIAGRIRRRDPLPEPSEVGPEQHAILLSAHIAAKAALYLALRRAQLTPAELATLLQCDETEVRRLLDPRHATRLPRLEAALAALGQQLVVGIEAVR